MVLLSLSPLRCAQILGAESWHAILWPPELHSMVTSYCAGWEVSAPIQGSSSLTELEMVGKGDITPFSWSLFGLPHAPQASTASGRVLKWVWY